MISQTPLAPDVGINLKRLGIIKDQITATKHKILQLTNLKGVRLYLAEETFV